MTLNISGRCLCGSVSFECSAEPIFQGCCHCDDCRRSGGSLYASFVFVPTETLLSSVKRTPINTRVTEAPL